MILAIVVFVLFYIFASFGFWLATQMKAELTGRTQLKKIKKTIQPDVFNHNLENVPRLYKEIRPGADYQWSLKLLHDFKEMFPNIPTKSGLMVGLGETNEEILQVMEDLRAKWRHHAYTGSISPTKSPSLTGCALCATSRI